MKNFSSQLQPEDGVYRIYAYAAQTTARTNSNPDEKFIIIPVDGAFDSQSEEIFT
jgi:hypothetical protein